MRSRAAFVYHRLSVDTIGRIQRSVNGTLFPCSSDGSDTRRQSRVFYRAMRMHKRGICCDAVSVRLSVRHVRGSWQNE